MLEKSGESSYHPKFSLINIFHRKRNNKVIVEATLMIIMLAAFSINAQSLALKLNQYNKYTEYKGSSTTLALLDSSTESVFGNVDSLFEDTKPKLLPDKMSIMESFLWGENGLTRKIGLVGDLTPEGREHELKIRRFMLTSH